MGLHVNKNLLKNENYRNHVKAELEALNELSNVCNGTVNKNNFKAYFDLCTGKDTITYQNGDGVFKQIQLKALKFDKLAVNKMRREDFTLYMDQVRNDFNEISNEVGSEVKGENFMSTSNVMYSYKGDYSTDYTNEEVNARKDEIEKNHFGHSATKPLQNLEELNLKDQILNVLDAKEPEDWLDCLPNEEIINDCLFEYEDPNPARNYVNPQRDIGEMIAKRRNGVPLTHDNVKPVLSLVQAKNEQYNSINGFRRFLSYINPFKDSVRDARNEINEAKKFLVTKGLKMAQIDSVLNGQTEIENLETPELFNNDTSYLKCQDTSKMLEQQIKNNGEASFFKEVVVKWKTEKILLDNAAKGCKGEYVDVEASIKEINALYPEGANKDGEEKQSRFPIGERLAETLAEDGLLNNDMVEDKDLSMDKEKEVVNEVEEQKEINVPQAK